MKRRVDIKPENVCVAYDGTTKLIDLGLAIDLNSDTPVSRVGAPGIPPIGLFEEPSGLSAVNESSYLCADTPRRLGASAGTLQFMAPELIRLPRFSSEAKAKLRELRQAQYTSAVDIWAIGCVAFEMLYGYSLFACEVTEEMERLHAGDNPIELPLTSRARVDISELALDFMAVRHYNTLQLCAFQCMQPPRGPKEAFSFLSHLGLTQPSAPLARRRRWRTAPRTVRRPTRFWSTSG